MVTGTEMVRRSEEKKSDNNIVDRIVQSRCVESKRSEIKQEIKILNHLGSNGDIHVFIH